MHKDLSSIQDIQKNLLSTITKMGANLGTLVNTKRIASLALQMNDKVTDSVSSRTSHKELSPLAGKDEVDDVDDKEETLLGWKKTTMMAFPIGEFGGSLVSEGYRNTSPPKHPSFETLGKGQYVW